MADEPNVTPAVDTGVQTPAKEVVDADEPTLVGGAEEGSGKVETKKDEVKKEEVKEVKKEEVKTVPDKYEIKAPEGLEINQGAIDSLTPIFKKYGLSNEAVQEIANSYAPIIKAQFEESQKEAINQWNKETDAWKAESLKILGADSKKELAYAAKIINKIGTKYKAEDGSEGNKLRDILEETRVGNHPEVARMFIALGKLISEDSFADPSKQSTGENSGIMGIYDHPTSKATLK